MLDIGHDYISTHYNPYRGKVTLSMIDINGALICKFCLLGLIASPSKLKRCHGFSLPLKAGSLSFCAVIGFSDLFAVGSIKVTVGGSGQKVGC